MFRQRIPLREGFIVAIASIAAALFIFRSYLFAGTLLFGDANFLWTAGQLHAELAALLNVWRTQSGGYSGAVTNATQMFVLLQALFSPLGIPLSTVLVWPALVAGAFLAMRKLAYGLGAGGWAAIVAAAFYAGNPWLWDQLLAGHVAICAASALAPVVLATLLDLYRARSGSGWLLFALCGLELLADARIALFVYAIVFTGAIVGFVRLRERGESHAARFAAFALLAPIAGVLANAWWTGIYAFAKTGDPVPAFYPPVEDIATYSGGADLPHVLVLSGYFLQFQWQRALQIGWPIFVLWYAAVVFMLVMPAVLAKHRAVRWAATIAIPVALIASMGSHGLPLDFLKWALAHVPLMGLLREPVKYGFIVALGISTLTALWLSASGARAKWIAGAAVAVMLVPVFSGKLQSPDGHGLQVFSQRPQFAAIAEYLQAHAADGTYRIAFLPPLLAEQSLAPGEFYVANPFVFQSEIQEIDAKLINTSTYTDNAAWQAFYELYWGTDRHPAQTLGNFGIRYVVLDDDVGLSAAAQYTSFARVPAGELHYLLAQDPHFKPVYHSGPYWIYENTEASPMLRTARTPILAGPLSAAVRAALPASALGDELERAGTAPVLSPIADVQADPLSACVDRAPYAALTNAYYSVGKHSDYTGFWVASDWMLRGGNTFEQRLLAHFPPPYAYTRSGSAIAVPLDVAKAGTLYAQLGTLGTRDDVGVTLDGKAAEISLTGNGGFAWYRVGSLTAGRHVLAVDGNAAGVLAGKVAVVTGDGCANPVPPAGRRFYLPGPLAAVSARLEGSALQIRSAGASVDSLPVPDGAAAFTIDDAPVVHANLTLLRGAHRVDFFGPSGAPINGKWTISEQAPYQPNAGTLISGARIRLAAGRWPQMVETAVAQIAPGQPTMLRYTASASNAGALLEVRMPDGVVQSSLAVRAGTNYVPVPYIGAAYTVDVRLEPGTGAPLVLDAPVVTDAAAIGDAAYFTLSAQASERRPVARSAPSLHAPLLRLTENGALADAAPGPVQIWTAFDGGAANVDLDLRGLSASQPVPVTVTAYYRMPFAGQQQWTVASIQATSVPANERITVPVLPNADAIAFSITTPTSSVVSLSEARLEPSPAGAQMRRLLAPNERAVPARPVAYASVSPEKLRTRRAVSGWIVGNFTYDPYWIASSGQHRRFDGYQNAWYVSAPAAIALRYALQSQYRLLQLLALAFFIVTFGAWAAARIRARRSGAASSQGSDRHGN